MHREDEGTKHAWFAYPLLVEEGRGLTRTGVQAHLEMCGHEMPDTGTDDSRVNAHEHLAIPGHRLVDIPEFQDVG